MSSTSAKTATKIVMAVLFASASWCWRAALAEASSAAGDNGTVRAQDLLGAWTIAADSPERSRLHISQGMHEIEEFFRDGKGVTTIYATPGCKSVLSADAFRWRVWHNVLYSNVTNRKVLADLVTEISADRIVLYSKDFHLTEIRQRTTPCVRGQV